LSGSLSSKFKIKNVLGFYYGLRPLTILFFLILPKTLLNMTIFTALFGFSGAATVPPVAGIINKFFGSASIGTLFGLVFFIHQIGGFFGAWFGGVCFSMTKSYLIIWCVSLVFGIIASVASFAIKEDIVTENK
jgi:predicted MFS family arabinose efflux permease